ncbi:HIT family protein [Streptomyces sp. NRRL F-5527]|uniref:HIT family protein n=1 Tax=Streptomyces sp. NRRL F-5527 TaxID=1463862 RepID=UPI0004C50DE5|nr:HIT domain-containing protein [Streptomyces sp. NRRL F-5527]
MPDHAKPRPAPAPSGAWPENFTGHRRGTNCPMCANDFAADDIGWGLLVRRGEVSNAYLWRSGQVRGYAVVIYAGRHVAEPTELDEGEAAAFWRDVLALGRAVEAFYEPLKMNYLLLGNQIPHAHWHCVPRREAGTDPAPGGPLPFEVLDLGRQDEEQVQADARALRQLLADADGRSGLQR